MPPSSNCPRLANLVSAAVPARRKKGPRLPIPPQIAAGATSVQWRRTNIRWRDRTVDRLLLRRVILWYQVTGALPILLVIVRDPRDHDHDDFFFTTDIQAHPADVVSDDGDRWAIELTFRDVKQLLTPQHPQSWRRSRPRRTVAVGFWLHSAVCLWFIRAVGDKPVGPDRPWYTRKCSPSFADALSALRATLWRERISAISAPTPSWPNGPKHWSPRLPALADAPPGTALRPSRQASSGSRLPADHTTVPGRTAQLWGYAA